MTITLTFTALVAVSTVIYQRMRPKRSETTDQRIETPRAFRAFYLYLLVSSLVAVIVCPNWIHPALLQWHQSTEIGFFGLAVAVSGMGLFVWSMAHLSAQYSPCYDAKLPSRVVASGPYSRIRHPVYTANLLLIAGVAVATGSWWMVLNFAGLLAFYMHCAPIEERALTAAFADYGHHMTKTGRFLPRWGTFSD